MNTTKRTGTGKWTEGRRSSYSACAIQKPNGMLFSRLGESASKMEHKSIMKSFAVCGGGGWYKTEQLGGWVEGLELVVQVLKTVGY